MQAGVYARRVGDKSYRPLIDGDELASQVDRYWIGLRPLTEQLGKLCSGAAGENCNAEELAKRLTAWLDEYRGATPVGDDRTFLIARRLTGTAPPA